MATRPGWSAAELGIGVAVLAQEAERIRRLVLVGDAEDRHALLAPGA